MEHQDGDTILPGGKLAGEAVPLDGADSLLGPPNSIAFSCADASWVLKLLPLEMAGARAKIIREQKTKRINTNSKYKQKGFTNIKYYGLDKKKGINNCLNTFLLNDTLHFKCF